MSGKYPFVANFQIAFLRTFALDYAVISLHTNTVTYLVEKRLIFHEETLKNYLKIRVFIVRRKKIKLKKCARAILDSDNKMPSCCYGVLGRGNVNENGIPRVLSLIEKNMVQHLANRFPCLRLAYLQ